MIDYEALLYGPLYDQDIGYGVPARLTPSSTGVAVDVTVIDGTQGVMLDEGNSLQIATVKVAASIRMSELATNNIARADLKQGSISFNNGNWTIVATQPKPNKKGDGELYLILEAA